VGVEATAQPAQSEANVPASVSFADTSYDVLTDLTLPDGTVLPAGSRTTPSALGLAGNIPAVHALVVAAQIWPTGVAR
jgi:hypothetical protein